jgi:hypothetical protein
MVISYVQLLHDTDYYKHLYRRIEDRFNDLTSVKPGTVGGYLAGCLIGAPQGNCSMTCAGAIPLPKGHEHHKPCDKAVIWCEWNVKDGFSFNISKHPDKAEDLNPVYLYVPCQSVHQFAGFNKAEKDKLSKLGINKVHLFGYNEECNKHVDLYGAPIDLKDVKLRSRVHNHEHNRGSAGLAVLLVLIFLIIIILFFGWKLWNNKQM